jgi:hypothetical protein
MCPVADTRTVALVDLVHAKNGSRSFVFHQSPKFGEKLAVTQGSGPIEKPKKANNKRGRYDVEGEFGLTA